MSFICIKQLYFLISAIFVFLQGPLYYSWHDFSKPEKINLKEVLLNSLGSIVGWGAGYFLLFFRLRGGLDNFNPDMSDIVIFLLASYGMTGNLPNILINKLKFSK